MPIKVVYILGAGFSAPLGLPVIKNFYGKAKDLYQEDRKPLSYFSEVIQYIGGLSSVSLYYESNQFNIEELLSIAEMTNMLTKYSDMKKLIKDFICDVIKESTPLFEPWEYRLQNDVINTIWSSRRFFGFGKWEIYGAFLAQLLNLVFQRQGDEISIAVDSVNDYTYGIVTLNYDLIIETLLDHWMASYSMPEANKVAKGIGQEGFPLAKLHGSIDGDVIPPTFNKNITEPIINAWRLAHEILSGANHIRFMGYSLPENDSSVRYLLKSSILSSSNLKTIDVICKDENGQVEKRYDEFVKLIKGENYRFVNEDIEKYLIFSTNNLTTQGGFNYTYDKLEDVHNSFLE